MAAWAIDLIKIKASLEVSNANFNLFLILIGYTKEDQTPGCPPHPGV
jgi:multisubunit Na+/H+ antiporter MnhC subunit